MIPVKFTIDTNEAQATCLGDEQQVGVKDKSTHARAGLERLPVESAHQQLFESADLYAELYPEDEELRELTESSLAGWPV